MARGPSLISLTVKEIKNQILREDHDNENSVFSYVYDLPCHLLDLVIAECSPLALQKLQSRFPSDKWNYCENVGGESLKQGRKRGRNENKFAMVWKTFFKLRFPEPADITESTDWQQMYWEAHVQNCLNETAEIASLPLFRGRIGDVTIPDSVLKSIGCEGHMDHSKYSKLSHHCQQFGCYLRCLRLQNVLFTAETTQLLKESKLQTLTLRQIRSKEHVDSALKLVLQNSGTLTSLEFIRSLFCPIVCSLATMEVTLHKLECFSIISSSFDQSSPSYFRLGVVSFIQSARSLSVIKLCDSNLEKSSAETLFCALLSSSASITVLDLSNNFISGWLSNIDWRSFNEQPSSLKDRNCLESLRVLNIRGNNLRKGDMESLRNALVYMPNLKSLDLSDNPIEDDGVKCLISYLSDVRVSELKLATCDLSCDGVTVLLKTLATFERPPISLSLADNDLGSKVARVLREFLGTSIQNLNISGVGLGSTGFKELRDTIIGKLRLVDLDISKNRGGLETANFLSKIILLAPDLVSVNMAYNLMPLESLDTICSVLEAIPIPEGKLLRLDLTGNHWEYKPTHDYLLKKFQRNGKPILILPSRFAENTHYDNDP